MGNLSLHPARNCAIIAIGEGPIGHFLYVIRLLRVSTETRLCPALKDRAVGGKPPEGG